LVKTASQTVTRPKFYDGFFQLLQRFLPDAQAAAAPHEPPVRMKGAAPKPAPAPAPADPVVAPNAPADTLNPTEAGGDKAAPAGDAPPAKTPAAGSPAPGTAAEKTPAAAARDAGSPAAGSPAAGSPAAGSPAAGSPAAGSPAAPATPPAPQSGN
jgi:hypothetical protein